MVFNIEREIVFDGDLIHGMMKEVLPGYIIYKVNRDQNDFTLEYEVKNKETGVGFDVIFDRPCLHPEFYLIRLRVYYIIGGEKFCFNIDEAPGCYWTLGEFKKFLTEFGVIDERGSYINLNPDIYVISGLEKELKFFNNKQSVDIEDLVSCCRLLYSDPKIYDVFGKKCDYSDSYDVYVEMKETIEFIHDKFYCGGEYLNICDSFDEWDVDVDLYYGRSLTRKRIVDVLLSLKAITRKWKGDR